MSRAKFGACATAGLTAQNELRNSLDVRTLWTVQCYRRGELIWVEFERPNVCTNQGIDAMLNIMFHASTQITTWYVAIFENNYTPLVTNTYATPGYTESTAYDEATRPAYVEAASASKVMTNSANKAVFTINATKTIYGASLVSYSTKNDTAQSGAILFCSSAFSAGRSVVDNDVLNVTVQITGADT